MITLSDSTSTVPVAPVPVGSVPTWEQVANEHGRFLYGLAYRLTGNHHDAQDVVQDVLIRVQRGLGSYQPGNIEGWLSRITTNAFLDRVRKSNRRPTVALPEDPDRVIEGSPGADAELAQESLPDDLQQLLSELSPEYRVPVVLKDVVGFSYEEISDALDVPMGTVRSRIHRGRAQLRRALEQDTPELVSES
ncbi:MAG: sigma-70 family RNA polymerase sigma factor [Acidimicrobiia bacterium]|nr:sigma-70 family RNA polymerase sigma factor [Acidimicrobiia bacterium]